ncbi:MAG: tRNA (adenosine(37)-N6)-threonylcarbamoyltransferase complex transferase subunit TsaD [Bacteroidetes bacterium]|nr:tRNA (adenosine(37)-N6)-threonylcarbamoyltransferase complex transferase subunit TsaD [Bacteroidota bacterium]MBT4967551.1 tRNA (adenosine(37)-N6)-threonylcarbamoyltransferase complex transferase subunit TsaD [Bacteroidota bacterium]MBT6836984.1 tRNA (adenosine(37)-N6)-threonylcarbamoyltransferase complex transferase subunit TsaD [Bacteroidota bacterium]MBT7038425.1 tRNA (adenosine(37)-N6)-threonylcarbamoyltransferase complex transferase subunit TsaD [Bacteroidota bacterium]MBT7827219.1 tRNA
MCVILALESSCDDTSASVLRNGKILTNIISSQAIHEKFGGVVPELASRAHQRNIVSVVNQAFKESGLTQKNLDAVAFTNGPGLIGSLLVASSFAKGLSSSLGIPLIGVNHLQAHVLANFIDDPKPNFPFLCLLVSGGHTQILKVTDQITYEIIGQTLDDAAGEAFDKAAKVIDLPYPGGPNVDKYAKHGNIDAFEFPTPKIQGLNFSFSGLKTSFLYKIRDGLKDNPNFIKENTNDLCASYQHRIVSYLTGKLVKASKQTGIKEIALAGGVAANSAIRERINELSIKHRWNTYIPQRQYCTDNAAMIAITAYYKYLAKDFSTKEIKTFAR